MDDPGSTVGGVVGMIAAAAVLLWSGYLIVSAIAWMVGAGARWLRREHARRMERVRAYERRQELASLRHELLGHQREMEYASAMGSEFTSRSEYDLLMRRGYVKRYDEHRRKAVAVRARIRELRGVTPRG